MHWEDAYVLGRSLRTHCLLNKERGGYLQFAKEEPVAVEAGCRTSSDLTRSLPLIYNIGSAPADDFLVEQTKKTTGDININAPKAALSWLKQELSEGDSHAFSMFFSAWAAIDMVCELHTVVENQQIWARMWRASHNSARVVNQQRIAPEPDGTFRLVGQISRYAGLSGSSEVLASNNKEYFVVPTPAVGLLVLILAANRQTLRSVLESDECMQQEFADSEDGAALLSVVGNLLWLSTFAIPSTNSM